MSFSFQFFPEEDTTVAPSGTDSALPESNLPECPSREHSVVELVPKLPEIILAERAANPWVWRRELSDVHFQQVQGDEALSPEGVRMVGGGESDLVSGVYEGGLKTWECADDLVAYLDRTFPAGSLDGQTILELGCGSALPSLHLARKHGGIANISVQDYNADVIELITFPNFILNAAEAAIEGEPQGELEVADVPPAALDALSRMTSYFSGDWASLPGAMNGRKYDLILTSETIYSADAYPQLYHAITGLLKQSGSVLLAAKTVYFGCSGDMRGFFRYVEGRGEMLWEQVYESSGSGVGREIVRVWPRL